MDNSKIAWAAGLIEGEGTICVKSRGGVYVGVSMTDEDVVRRIHYIAEIGTVTMPKKIENRKQVWTWRAAKRSEVVAFIKLLRPHMGIRRTAAIDKVLQYDKENPQFRVPKGELIHGIRNGYVKGCRCDLCKLAEKRYREDVIKRRKMGQLRQKGVTFTPFVQRIVRKESL